MRAVAAHRRACWRTRCGVDAASSLSRRGSRAGSGALEPFSAVGGLGQVGQVCRIALGVVLRCVGYLVLVTFWGAVLELLSHLQQASPRGPSCLLNQSLRPVIRGPMQSFHAGGFGMAQRSHLL